MKVSVVFVLFFASIFSYAGGKKKVKFSKDFMFGVTTAAYQIEGGWNADDKGENIWDRLTHTKPDYIFDQNNGDVACDSYHSYKRDIEMLKELGVDFYRFSLSWSRILPNGFANKVSEAGVRYYNKLIDGLLVANITPMVTLYHWDVPQPLQDLGGWPNREMVNYFEDYARVAFDNFGDRVKWWSTFNEPPRICQKGYGSGTLAPGYKYSGIADYLCGHNVLLAHGRVYHLYNDTYRGKQSGKIGIILDANWPQPATDSTEDYEAAERVFQFWFGWHGNPIFSKEGDYPKVMKERIAKKSKEQGYPRSRLPELTKEEIKSLIGSSDFLSFNHYTTFTISNAKSEEFDEGSLYDRDLGTRLGHDSSWTSSETYWAISITPWGFLKILERIKVRYDNPMMIITENGFSTYEGLNDTLRIRYIKEYLTALSLAIENGCNIQGYSFWSLMDTFEWVNGFLVRFGLYEVDFKSAERKRTIRESGNFYKKILKTRTMKSDVKTENFYSCKHNIVNNTYFSVVNY